MMFGIQVKVFNPHLKEYEWLWAHASGSTTPYAWKDETNAHYMKRMMYPESSSDFVRVQQYDDVSLI